MVVLVEEQVLGAAAVSAELRHGSGAVGICGRDDSVADVLIARHRVVAVGVVAGDHRTEVYVRVSKPRAVVGHAETEEISRHMVEEPSRVGVGGGVAGG